MKICHIITRMIIGGAQENTLFSCLGQINDGHDVTLITGPTSGPEGALLQQQKVEGLKVIEVPSLIRALNPIADWKAYREIKRIIQEEQYDIVHTHASKAGILGRIAATKARTPGVIHTVHGSAFHKYEKAWKNSIYIASEKIAAQNCHHIATVADAMTKQFLDAGIASKEKYSTVYSGMDIDSFIRQPNKDLAQKLDIPDSAIVIGKVARLFELKGHDDLIEAAKIVVANNPNVIFLLVGDGLLRESLEEKIKSYGLWDNFRFAGLVPPDTVPDYISLMDIVCHLSYREGLPRAIVQGLAASKPAVAYALDGTPEVVLNDKTGFCHEAGAIEAVAQSLTKLIENKAMRQELGKNGHNIVKDKFPWRVMCDHLEKIYLSCLNGN